MSCKDRYLFEKLLLNSSYDGIFSSKSILKGDLPLLIIELVKPHSLSNLYCCFYNKLKVNAVLGELCILYEIPFIFERKFKINFLIFIYDKG